MKKISKNRKQVNELIDIKKSYSLNEAIDLTSEWFRKKFSGEYSENILLDQINLYEQKYQIQYRRAKNLDSTQQPTRRVSVNRFAKFRGSTSSKL